MAMNHMSMSHASMSSMVMTSATSAAAAATSPAMSMGEMDMGGGMGPNACKISMLWNWYTIDSCFLAKSWHVRSSGGFAGSCIGAILLVISLEFLRRMQREFDRYLRRPLSSNDSETGSGSGASGPAKGAQIKVAGLSIYPFRTTPNAGGLKLWQQVIRALLYMLQFAVGYFIMLLAMYYNGYIIISIFIGAFLGAMIFQWDTFGAHRSVPPTPQLGE